MKLLRCVLILPLAALAVACSGSPTASDLTAPSARYSTSTGATDGGGGFVGGGNVTDGGPFIGGGNLMEAASDSTGSYRGGPFIGGGI